jgi:hypothetical protein
MIDYDYDMANQILDVITLMNVICNGHNDGHNSKNQKKSTHRLMKNTTIQKSRKLRLALFIYYSNVTIVQKVSETMSFLHKL